MPSLDQLATLARAAIDATKKANDHWVNVGSDEWKVIRKTKADYCNAVDNSEEVILALIDVAKVAKHACDYRYIDHEPDPVKRGLLVEALHDPLLRLEALCPSS